jgi:hypothetical protein
MAQTELRDFLLFLFQRTEFQFFSLPWRIRNVIPRVPSIFVPRNGILSCFSLPRKGSEWNRVFCSAGQPEFRRKYPFVPAISSSVEFFFCLKFPTQVLSPPVLQTVFGMAAYTLSAETIKFFLVRYHINILMGTESEG